MAEFGVTGAAPLTLQRPAAQRHVVTHSTLKSRTRRPITSFTADLQCRVRPPSGHDPVSPVPFRACGRARPPPPLCTSLTDIVESRSHVSSERAVPRARCREPLRLPTPARTRPPSRRTEKVPTRRQDRRGVGDCRRMPGRIARTSAHPAPGGRFSPLKRPATYAPRAARCGALLPGWRDRRRSSRATECPAALVTDLHLTPTALRNKVNQYGGKCASRFPGQSPFGGCSGRKTTGHGRRNRAM